MTQQDVVERMQRYIYTTIKIADKITIVQLITRMKELNAMIPYLPCLKQREGSPEEILERMKPFLS